MMNQQEAELFTAMGNLLRVISHPKRKKLDADTKKRFDKMLNIMSYEIDRTVDHFEIMLDAGEANDS